MYKSIILSSVFIFTVFCSSLSIAVSDKEVAKCAAVSNDINRLECYDNLAKSNKLAPNSNIKSANKGDWKVNIDVNPLDDSKTVILSIYSNENIRTGFRNQKIPLIIRCKSNTTDLYINWANYLGLDSTNVTTRIDKDNAITEKWVLSTDNKATFARNAISLAKRMLQGSTLIAQTTPYSESPVMVTFNLDGLQEAIKPLRETCKW